MSHLGLVLPSGPFFLSAVLRVPAIVLGELGAAVRDVGLEPGYNPSGTLDDNRDYFRGVGEQVQAIVDEDDWAEVTIVVKSIGTMILGTVGSTLSLPEKVNVLWLTPIFAIDEVRDGAVTAGWRSLVVSGSADWAYDATATRSVVDKLGAAELLVEGADHNLEIAGDVRATLSALDALATATRTFLTSDR